MPFTKKRARSALSSINKANIPMASEKQLQEIVDDNDLTVDDMHFVKSHMDLLTVAKSKDPQCLNQKKQQQ